MASNEPSSSGSRDRPLKRGAGAVSSGVGASSALGVKADRDGHDRFGAGELGIVLSHYDLGVVDAIEEFPRGSRRAPKLIIRSEHGTHLLKRRATGRDDPFKVAFCHEVQLFLTQKQFPLPHLIGTRRDNNSMLQWNGAIYELFEFVKGANYDGSPLATTESGKTLALFHKLLRDYQPEYEPSVGTYHASPTVATSINVIPRTLAKVDPATTDQADQIHRMLEYLRSSYDEAAARVDELGLTEGPMQVIHCDWHPGNMLFRDCRIVAVIDYDGARLQQRMIDVANGALQFSIRGRGDPPDQWPNAIDFDHFQHFLQGYESTSDRALSQDESKAIPWLMIEALIAESAIPIANTGAFARIEGVGFLRMVERKVRWLREHAAELTQGLETH